MSGMDHQGATTPNPRCAVITGGNKGLGFETARRLHARGYAVYIGARDAAKGQVAAKELGVTSVRLDVTDETSIREAAAELQDREGRVDVLVNNAGVRNPIRPVADYTGTDATSVFDTNVTGIVRVTQAFLPLLEKSASPIIVNVSSRLGSFAAAADPERGPGLAAARDPLYAASKAAVNMLTVQYATAFPHIRINAANPGFTATDILPDEEVPGAVLQTITEGTDAIVELADLDGHGPTGTFQDRRGTIDW